MKSIHRVTLGLLGSLTLMATLPSCVVVDPGYVAVSTGYTSSYRNYGVPARRMAPSYYGYSSPSYCQPAPCVHTCESYAPPVHRSYNRCDY